MEQWKNKHCKAMTSMFSFPCRSVGKESAYNAGDAGSIPRSGRSPGEGMATHSSILAWRIPWTEEPGGLQSMGSQESDTTQQPNHQQYVLGVSKIHALCCLWGFSGEPWWTGSRASASTHLGLALCLGDQIFLHHCSVECHFLRDKIHLKFFSLEECNRADTFTVLYILL